MRWGIAAFLLLLAGSKSTAQVNYVRNGGFEQFSRCPFLIDQIRLAKGWTPIDSVTIGPDSVSNGNCSAEYCNECSSYPWATVPHNNFFYQYPRSGKGM